MENGGIYVALGTNMGDKQENLHKALTLMHDKGIKILKTSSWYSTEPYGFTDQDPFLNGVVEVAFSGEARELLKMLLHIEKEMKRVRKIHWGPRIIDLDIILFRQEIIDEPELTVPHADMHNRDFVLRPFAEIAPEVVHPVFQKTIQQLFDEIESHNQRFPL